MLDVDDELTNLNGRAAVALRYGMYTGLMHTIKVRFESQMTVRTRYAPGETGGRYRCLPPERMVRAGYTPLMSEADAMTLKRDRYVVVDEVLSPELLAQVQAVMTQVQKVRRELFWNHFHRRRAGSALCFRNTRLQSRRRLDNKL